MGGDLIVASDFNSKAIEWSMSTINSRGRRLLDMAARLLLEVANMGNAPTFRREGRVGTIPNITLVSDERISKTIREWKVLEDYTGRAVIVNASAGCCSVNRRTG